MVGADKTSDKKSKRKASLLKKASELSILCGVDVCLVIYGPDNRPETFPKKPEEVERVITRYRASGIDKNPKRKRVLSDIVGPRKAPVLEEEDGSRRASKKSKNTASNIDDLSLNRLVALIDRLNSRIESVESMVASKEKEQQEQEQEREQEEDLKRNKEIVSHVDATPIASWYPGWSAPLETVNPVMMMDANGSIHWGVPLSYGYDQYVPVLCYVPVSSQVNYRAEANENGFCTSHM